MVLLAEERLQQAGSPYRVHCYLQIEWHPMCWIPEMIPYAKKHNIALQAYSSLGSGNDRLLEHPVVKEV